MPHNSPLGEVLNYSHFEKKQKLAEGDFPVVT